MQTANVEVKFQDFHRFEMHFVVRAQLGRFPLKIRPPLPTIWQERYWNVPKVPYIDLVWVAFVQVFWGEVRAPIVVCLTGFCTTLVPQQD